jgi:hypothetical protein
MSRRVEYVVVALRGGIAEIREPGAGTKVRKTDAAMLAFNLRVEESSLPGRRYSCRVEPAEYGIIRSDFQLLPDADQHGTLEMMASHEEASLPVPDVDSA